MAAPVSKGDELELHVDSLAYGGNGVARLNGFVVFVRRGLPGDTVRATVTKVKRGFAEATATEVVTAGAPRVDAPCEHYPACGGCRFQDLAYEAQIAAKQEQVRDALVRHRPCRRPAARGDPPGRVAVPLPQQARVLVHRHAAGRGARLPPGRALGRGARGRALLADHRARQRDPRRRCGTGRRRRGCRRSTRSRRPATCATSSSAKGATPARRSSSSSPRPATSRAPTASSTCCARFPEVRSIQWAVNDSPAEVTNLPTNLLWGEEAIEEELLGLRYRVRPNAFLQTNTAMAERLYELAIDYAELTGDETVYDLYCGIGSIGLSMASRALTVWGVEISEESVACAIENAGLNGVTNAAFFAGEVGRVARRAGRARGDARRGRRRPAARGTVGQGAASPSRAWRRRGSSMSPATRPRWPGTSRISSATGATHSSARARWTCSRTRRTWRACRCWRA